MIQNSLPRGSIYTPIMELGSQNHSGDGLLGPNSIIVVYMDPLGKQFRYSETATEELKNLCKLFSPYVTTYHLRPYRHISMTVGLYIRIPV